MISVAILGRTQQDKTEQECTFTHLEIVGKVNAGEKH
jgi:hypothetical protein